MTDETHVHEPVPCRLSDLAAYEPKEGATPEELEKGLETIAKIDGYLSNFAKPIVDEDQTLCFHCGEPLSGALVWAGGFRWGLVHGEGNCGGCGWPARGHHRPLKEDGTPLFTIENFPLQYLPMHVTRADALDEN